MICCSHPIYSQSQGIIIDKISRLPIPYVSIYSNKNDIVNGTMSDDMGNYNLKYAFDTLYYSHINYKDTIVIFPLQNDTIFMSSKIYPLKEIVVTPQKANWINDLLKEVVRNRKNRYQVDGIVLEYDFLSKSLTDSTGYIFTGIGNICLPQYKEKQLYTICPQKNIIRSNIKEAKADFIQMGRSLYHNFIKEFDSKFIKNTDFKLTSFVDKKKPELLKFSYNSKIYPDNSGYILVDTLQKVIIEFEQNLGSNYNINTNTTLFTRNLAAKKGFSYIVWNTIIYGKYTLINKSYYMTECRYQYYLQISYKKNSYFSNIESILKLNSCERNSVRNCQWLKLPSPYSILIIKSKNKRLIEEALLEVPVYYESF
jgi:hypothetical protein